MVSLKGGNDDLHLPSPVDVVLDEVSNLQSNEITYEQKNLDPQLSNLPAANLKSTFAKAYDLLTEIVVKTGWESLLKYRAKVFVMEEEYRKDKSTNSSTSNINGDHKGMGHQILTLTQNLLMMMDLLQKQSSHQYKKCQMAKKTLKVNSRKKIM